MGINTATGRRATGGVLGLAILLGGGLFLMRANAVPGAAKDTPPTGKITPWQAMKIANAKQAGKPIQALFENDEGKWIYGVVIVDGKTIHEVEVDVNTGKVGDSEVITPEGEGKEVTQELNAAIGNKSAAAPEVKEGAEKQ